ncbi:ATP-dependent DNA helicase DinG [Bacillus oleivorans]|uniref:ATP-dependent DNA helicase DinG n=1 Tax=Bacillus oleivorans TaxID=1448271 RepID=A0A285CKU4_9BACI|nr:exonuclease domain-containing protein [Bacillus oleivorans]SNX68171.1 ATP-dependent DNA helicase DinG [Bacillus oleivorans]
MNRFVVVDLETTGNKAKADDRIIQLGAVLIENGEIMSLYSTFIQPKRPIPSFISELTGIDESLVKDAPVFKDAVRPFLNMCKGACLVAHNSAFDLSFLQEEYKRNGFPIFDGNVIDTVELARFLYPTSQSFSLQGLAKELDIDHSTPHRADADAEVTAKIFKKMLQKLKQLPAETLEQLEVLSFYLKSDIQLLLQNILVQKDDRDATENLSYYNGIWLKGYTPPSDIHGHTVEEQPSINHELVKAIQTAWEQGKQYFYEVSHISPFFLENLTLWVKKQFNEPLWIVTREPKRWESFFKKEELELPFSTLKGRHHYLSLRKFSQVMKEDDPNYDHVLTKMQILIWLLETDKGDVDELNLSSASEDFWIKISTDATDHQNTKDPAISFYQRTVIEATLADCLITNYPMFLSESLYQENSVLRPRYCILDQPEILVEQMPKYFGKKLTFVSFRIWLRQLEGQFLSKLFIQDTLKSIELTTKKFVERLKEESEDFFQFAADYALLHEESVAGFSPYVSAPLQPSQTLDSLLYAGERLLFSLKDLVSYLVKQLTQLQGTSDQYDQLLIDYKLFKTEAEEIIHTLESFISPGTHGVTKWIETDTRGMSNYTAIISRPLLASKQLGDFLSDRGIEAVFISSSLSVNRSFLFSVRSLGFTMNQVQVNKEKKPTRNQLLVANRKYSIEKIASFAADVCSQYDKVFVLTSSYDETQAITDAIQKLQNLEGFVLLSQSQASIGRLLKQMNRFDKAIYIGSQFSTNYTSHEESSEAFIITKLPFLSPQDLYHRLQVEEYEKEGRNPFYHFSLPYAVLRLKRLIAKINFPNNRIYLLDSRIWQSEYGKTFIQSIEDLEWKPLHMDE